MKAQDQENNPSTKAIKSAHALENCVNSIIKGQEEVVRKVLAAMLAGGHVLLEDNPGTGKTTFAKAIAAAVSDTLFSRVQFTPDLLPSDIVGVSVIEPSTHKIRFQEGPIFTDVLLADEINRASPRTQSALLEAMAEQQVTIEGKKHALSEIFFVIATQNPVEFRGTYPLPEAQMDRFALQCSLGYVSQKEEVQILKAQSIKHPLHELQPVLTREALINIRNAVRNINISEEIQHYIVALTAATRSLDDVILPASPRASISLMHLAQALSLFEGRDFVVPETVQKIAPDVIGHRLVLSNDAKFSGKTGKGIVEQLLQQVNVPV